MSTDDPGAARRALRLAAMSAGVTGSYVGYLLQRAFLGEERREETLKSAHGQAARRMLAEMQRLRGPVMKLGQTLSLQTDLLPEEMLAELSKLQMQAPGMHPSLVDVQFKNSLGHVPEDVFREFDREPFAAASLGQVHRAITRDGRAVAVKIQYPGIRRAVENDFKWFRTLSKLAQASGHVPTNVIDELQAQIVAETDYGREASNIEYFQGQLKPLHFVSVPAVYRQYSSDRVLTMSIVGGRHLDDFLRTRPSQPVRDRLGQRLMELFYFQILNVNAFHADPHWGNYLFKADGAIGLIDFGCVKYLKPEFVRSLKRLYLYPGRRESKEFQRELEERYALFGQKLLPATRRALAGFAERFYRKVYPPDPSEDDRPFDFGDVSFLQDYMREANALTRAKGALPEHLFMARAEMGLYQTLHRLRAKVRTSEIVRKYLS